MNRSILWLAAAAAVPFVAIMAQSTDARAEVWPPGTYIASYEPVYYNGFAHYFWHDRWYYRDHGGWHGYEHEPEFLRGRRGEWAHHWHHWR
jgi:hypothetical protein